VKAKKREGRRNKTMKSSTETIVWRALEKGDEDMKTLVGRSAVHGRGV
jgi:hypothetical protein